MGIFSSKQNQSSTTTANPSSSTTSSYKISTIQSNSSIEKATNHIKTNDLDVEMASNVAANATTTSSTMFAIGDTVMAKWKENDAFYPAKIVSLNRKKNRLKYLVSFYDDVKDSIAEEDVRAVEANEMSLVAKKFADAQNSATTSKKVKVSKKKVTNGPKKVLKRLKEKSKTTINKKSVAKKLKKIK
jgi:hypothetical protein